MCVSNCICVGGVRKGGKEGKIYKENFGKYLLYGWLSFEDVEFI